MVRRKSKYYDSISIKDVSLQKNQSGVGREPQLPYFKLLGNNKMVVVMVGGKAKKEEPKVQREDVKSTEEPPPLLPIIKSRVSRLTFTFILCCAIWKPAATCGYCFN